VKGGSSGSVGAEARSEQLASDTGANVDSDDAGIVVIARRSGSIFDHVDYFPQATLALLDFDVQTGGLEYAAAEQRQRLVQDYAAQYRSIMPVDVPSRATVDGFLPQPVGGVELATSFTQLDTWRARAYDTYKSGYVEDGVQKTYSEAYYNDLMEGYNNNEALIHGWNARADREVVDLIGSVYGAVDVAKGAYRITVNGEHTVDNYLSAGSPLLGVAGTLGGKLVGKIFSGFSKTAKGVPALRQQYIDAVEGLAGKATDMRAAGNSTEQIARTLHADRRALGVQFKDLTPEAKRIEIYDRNIVKYGDKLGPSIDWLRAQGKSWEQIIESAIRPGGKDLKF